MKLCDACSDYLKFLRTYQSGLNAFLRWLVNNGRPDPTAFDFTTAALRRYLYFNSERGLRPRTLRGKFHPLAALAKFLLCLLR